MMSLFRKSKVFFNPNAFKIENYPNLKGKKTSYSQCGEDLLVQYIFNLRNISNPSYLDVGANDPFYLSNTALFYEQGCRGINIEANPALIRSFIKARPEDVNLNIGIGQKETIMDFYVMNDPTLSSFSAKECEKYIETGKYHIISTLKIKISTIQKILEEFNNGIFPDFLFLMFSSNISLEV